MLEEKAKTAEEIEAETMKNFYKVSVKCSNCGAIYTETIFKGVMIGTLLCQKCGCETISRKELN